MYIATLILYVRKCTKHLHLTGGGVCDGDCIAKKFTVKS